MRRAGRIQAVTRKVEALLQKTTENGATPGEELAALTLAASLLDRYFLNNGWWQTAIGPINVNAMEVRHIKNCMRLIERTGRRQEWLVRFHLELVLRQLNTPPPPPKPPPIRRKNMGIDIYMHWHGQTKEDHDKQITGFSTTAGEAGYLREAYHGGPYVTRYLVQESFDESWYDSASEEERENYKGKPIPAATLRERLPRAIVMAAYRHATVYGGEDDDMPNVVQLKTTGEAMGVPNITERLKSLKAELERIKSAEAAWPPDMFKAVMEHGDKAVAALEKEIADAPPPTEDEVKEMMNDPGIQRKLRDVFAGIEIMKGGGDELVFAQGIPPELLTMVEERIKTRALPDFCLSFVDFVRLAELKEKETGQPVNVYASY